MNDRDPEPADTPVAEPPPSHAGELASGGATEPGDPALLLREVGAALRWAAWGGAARVERVTPPPPSSSQPSPSQPSPSQASPSHTAPHAAGHGALRPGSVPAPQSQPERAPVGLPEGRAAASRADRLAALHARVGACERCELHGGRRHIVHGRGDPHARLFIIGAAPGDDADGAGEPCAGPDGDLLDRMLAAMGLSREAVFVSGLVRCRSDADPSATSLAACTPFLRTELQIVAPEVILLLGEVPARFLLKAPGVAGARGQWRSLLGTPTMATWGLATMRQQPGRKRDAWQALQAVMARLGLRR